MKAAALVACALCASAAIPASAADAFKDPWCPSASASVGAFTSAGRTNDPLKIADAAAAAADAYRACAANALAVAPNAVEPAVNYDRLRVAQFTFARGRALAAAGRTGDALPLLRDARALADQVASWQPGAQGYVASNGMGGSSAGRSGDRQGSTYQRNAEQVRDAADTELARLSPAPATAPAAR